MREWFTLGGAGWERFEATFAVPPATAELAIDVATFTPDPVLICDASLVAGAEREAPLYELGGLGVLRATAWAGLRATRPDGVGVVTFPIPGTYRRQVPLSFEVQSRPADAIRDYRWVRRPDGLNWLCEVTVRPPADGAVVGWEALVLVGPEAQDPLPPADRPEAPEHAAAWLRNTACVQSDDPAIRAKAEELAEGADGIEAYARRVMQFTSTNDGRPGAFARTLDARAALDCGGSCTNRANLGAALLRARGIPARTVAHLPTWAGPLYEHWLVEYWHPGAGWTRLETSYDRFRPQPWTLAVLGVASPEDEDGAFDPLQSRFVVPGAPYRSVHACSAELREEASLKGSAGAHNLAVPESRLAGDDIETAALFEAALAGFDSLARQGEAGHIPPERARAIRQAIGSGQAGELTRSLRSLSRSKAE